ncbi:outer membrane beta-barrel protein [Hymenobacter sp. BT635]|uniref:Outer membrane beta-barrel protein n=1 Tax=Hymenobacter nitidus TaxID=2880929 RepID=A0ABS8AFI8_9BACT|nr:outer membrane beta-barrel protein [Hymenobacter nitidus]MCB2379021.1 outer membrane beta-barrel protein [Hymenobacter nitidus]
MTEHESEDLYQELRRKLADYGSQPSEEVWAGIRQQLPAMPVVVPARRSRRVLWRSVAALVLVGLAVFLTVLGTRQGRRSGQAQQPLTQRATQPKSAATASAASPVAATASSRPSATTYPTAPTVTTATPAPLSRAKNNASASTTSTTTTNAQAPSVPAATGPARRSTVPTGAETVGNQKSVTRRNLASAPRPAVAGALSAEGTLAAHSARRQSLRNGTSQPELPFPSSPRRTQETLHQQEQAVRRTADPALSPGAEPASVAWGNGDAEGRITAPNLPGSPAAFAEAATVAARQPPPGTAPATANTTPTVPSSATSPQPAFTSTLNLRAVQPAPASFPLPAPLSGVLLDSTRRQMAVAGRWAVQLLAGPAYTYRQLSGQPETSSPPVAPLERAAVGYSAQLSGQYAATPRLALSLGAGYTEFATRLNLIVPTYKPEYTSFRYTKIFFNNGRYDTLRVSDSTMTMRRDSSRLVRQRDTYRFLTVPVQVQYRLGTTGRFSYQAVLGASLNLYVGGRTTQNGEDCRCEQRTWGPSGSPFRVANVGLLAGLGVEYRLTGRWQLLAQPTFHYSLTPVSRSSEVYTRRPFGLGLQTGVRLQLP